MITCDNKVENKNVLMRNDCYWWRHLSLKSDLFKPGLKYLFQ